MEVSSKMASKRQHKINLKKSMETLGTYDSAFNYTMDVLAQLQETYDLEFKKFNEVDNGESVFTNTKQNGEEVKVKNPRVTVLEKLRTDILKYLNELGITPKALEAEAKSKTETKKPKTNGNNKLLNMAQFLEG